MKTRKNILYIATILVSCALSITLEERIKGVGVNKKQITPPL